MTVMAAPLERMASELKANPRLQLGLMLILGLIWIFGFLVMDDLLIAQRKEIGSVLKNISRWEKTLQQNEWPERLNEAKARSQELSKRLWREETQGLAQAAFGDWFAQAAVQSAITRPQIAVSVQAQDGGPQGIASELWKVSARASFDFDPRTLPAFLGKLASEEKLMITETLNIKSSPTPRVEMLVVAYFGKAEK